MDETHVKSVTGEPKYWLGGVPLNGESPMRLVFRNDTPNVLWANGQYAIQPGETVDIGSWIPVVITPEKRSIKLILGDPPEQCDPWPAMSVHTRLDYHSA